MKRPKIILSKDDAYIELKKAIQVYFDELEKKDLEDEVDDNYENAIFERAVELFYGEDVWDWINTKLL